MGEVISLPIERNPFTMIARRVRLSGCMEDLDLIWQDIERGGFPDDVRNALEVLVAKRRRELFRSDGPPGVRAA